MSRRTLVLLVVLCLLFSISLVIGSLVSHPAPAQKPLGRAFYVWQQEWRAATREAVLRAAPEADALEVFAAEAHWQDGRCTVRRHAPDWATLAEAGRPIIAVVRLGAEFARPIESPPERAAIAHELALLASVLRDRASAAGATLSGLQLDYDCPTARLGGYRALLDDLRRDTTSFLAPSDADKSGAALRSARGSLSGGEWLGTSADPVARTAEHVSADERLAFADGMANRARAGGPRHLSAEFLPQVSEVGPLRRAPIRPAPTPATPDASATPAAPATLALSITTLPTWLPSRDFARLVQGLDHFVLQVHSFDPPKNVSAPNTLCDTPRVEGWVRTASRCHVPFWVALPTYGYHAVFAPDGSFRAILAENAPSSMNPAPGVTIRTVRADPALLAGLVGRLAARRPPECRGIVWFRLPVAADRLNWSWPTLAAVMAGHAPRTQYGAELRRPQPDLYELWLSDTGEDNTADRVRAELAWPGRSLVAADGLNGFVVSGADSTRPAEVSHAEAARVEGPAPQPGRPVLAGWFRFAPTDAGATSVTVASVQPCVQDTDKP